MKDAGLALMMIVLAAFAAPAPLASAPQVVIETPTPKATLIGDVPVVFRVEGVKPDQVASASVLVDRRQVARLTAPPWQAIVDFGDDLASHRLEVVVELKDGQKIRAGFTSQRPAGTVVEVRLVNLAVTVTDRSGRSVKNLSQSDFEVLDAGKPVELAHWEPSPAELAVAIVLDTSLSMQGEKIEAAQSAASELIEKLEPQDQVMLMAFSDEVLTRTPLTADHDAARSSLREFSAGGGTALYDAVFAAASALREVPGEVRKVLVLLSDGRDEAASGLEPGSFHTQEESIRQAHNADATIFALGLGPRLNRETDFTGRLTTEEVLDRFARTTGGVFREVTSGRLGAAFRKVLEEVRQQYGMSYRPPPPRPGDTWRSIEVRVRRPGVEVRTREGYFVD